MAKISFALAGIDTSIFKGHSTRAAATSYAQAKGLSSQAIMKAAGWTAESTFAKFYSKSLTHNNFGDKLLSSLDT